MTFIDRALLFCLVLMGVAYAIVGDDTLKHESIVKGPWAIRMELTELLVIVALLAYAVYRREWIPMVAFTIVFMEHLRQIASCRRHSASGLRNILTIKIYIVCAILAVRYNYLWTLLPIAIGTLIHSYAFLQNRPFISKVCLASPVHVGGS